MPTRNLLKILLSSIVTLATITSFTDSAAALDFNFSFNDTGGGGTLGPIEGVIKGLNDNQAGQQATAIVLTGVGSQTLSESAPLPVDVLSDPSWQPPGTHSFSVNAGLISFWEFAVLTGPPGAPPRDVLSFGRTGTEPPVFTSELNNQTVFATIGLLDDITFTPVASSGTVPEPNTLTLLALGLATLLGCSWRRHTAPTAAAADATGDISNPGTNALVKGRPKPVQRPFARSLIFSVATVSLISSVSPSSADISLVVNTSTKELFLTGSDVGDPVDYFAFNVDALAWGINLSGGAGQSRIDLGTPGALTSSPDAFGVGQNNLTVFSKGSNIRLVAFWPSLVSTQTITGTGISADYSGMSPENVAFLEAQAALGTLLTDETGAFSDITMSVIPEPSSVTPEPSTLVLAALGLLSLSFVGWRRRKHIRWLRRRR